MLYHHKIETPGKAIRRHCFPLLRRIRDWRVVRAVFPGAIPIFYVGVFRPQCVRGGGGRAVFVVLGRRYLRQVFARGEK